MITIETTITLIILLFVSNSNQKANAYYSYNMKHSFLTSIRLHKTSSQRHVINRSILPINYFKNTRSFHRTTPLNLNRILFDPHEVNNTDIPTVTLPKSDYRTIHAAKILNLQNNDTIRAGIVSDSDLSPNSSGLITDDAIVTWHPEGKIKKPQPTKNGEPPGSLHVSLPSLSPPPSTTSKSPPLSLILALPRPLQLNRLLPIISQMGVDRLILTAARKVPKDYFGADVFRKPEKMRRLLIEGLCQSGYDVRLPRVTVVKRLKVFLEDELEGMFPGGRYVRVFAHPTRRRSDDGGGVGESDRVAIRMRDVVFPEGCDDMVGMVVAVGPEGGWEEDYELDLLAEHGFQQVTMGERVLRSDVAVVSLLSLAHDVCAHRVANGNMHLMGDDISNKSGGN